MAVIFVLRLVLEDSPNEALFHLCVLPIALVALVMGIQAGVAMAALSFAVFAAWVELDDPMVNALGYAARAATFGGIAVLVGLASATLRGVLSGASRAEQRLRSVFDAAHDALVSMDSTGVITAWNPAAEGLLGWPAEKVIGRTVAEVVIPERFRPQHWTGLQLFLATGEGPVIGTRIEVPALHREGHEVPVELTISAYRPGAQWEFTAFMHDISERKRAEALREEAERSKDELLALVSHELRTPLTSIVGYAELLGEESGGGQGLSDTERRRFIEVINRNGRRLLRLVGDLLFVARLEAGRLEMERTEVDLAAVASDSIEAAMPHARNGGVELFSAIEPVPAIAGDPGRIGQAIDNLLSNAIKFTPAGGEVSLRVAAADRAATIEVTDTGVGIPAAEQARLFERFFRASSAVGEQASGVGLGLVITKAIVEGHGGKLEFHSVEGEGTTFRAELPLALI